MYVDERALCLFMGLGEILPCGQCRGKPSQDRLDVMSPILREELEGWGA